MGILDGIGSTRYPDGGHRPMRGYEHNWHVWCATGALEVLRSGEHETWLRDNPGDSFTINFGNNSSSRHTAPEHPFWRVLKEVACAYKVEVFPLCFGAEYRLWTGADDDLRAFDCIKISAKDEPVASAADVSVRSQEV